MKCERVAGKLPRGAQHFSKRNQVMGSWLHIELDDYGSMLERSNTKIKTEAGNRATQ